LLKTLVAYTTEIDDTEWAADDISKQLPPESLCAHSVGIISCHYEFIHSGAMKAVCDVLPFPVVGTISVAQATNGAMENFLLTMMVLTSDEADFIVQGSASLRDDPHNAVAQMYHAAFTGKPDKPAYAFAFLPFGTPLAPDVFVEEFTALSGGLPCFGSVALDDTADFSNSFVCINGEAYLDRAAILLVYAAELPRFLLATISREKVLPNPAKITKSKENILMEVNGRHVEKYFESLGLENSTGQYAMASLPFMMDFNDGTPLVSRVFTAHTPENYFICAGFIPEGSLMYMGVFDKEDVLRTTGGIVKETLAQGASGALMFSCIARSMALGADRSAELSLVKELIGNKIPFLAAYAGGEICPTHVSEEKANNRFHNNTFIICLF